MTKPVTVVNSRSSNGRVVGRAAGIAAASALACGVCCILPFALPAALLATTGGILAWLAKIHPMITMIALVAVMGSWAWVIAQTLQTRRKPATSTLVAMSAATIMLGVALAWPLFEQWIFRLFRP
jgi:hypothetical protein